MSSSTRHIRPPDAASEPVHRDISIAEQRVSSLVGDRLCISCGYNLIGQPVLREPHYQMLIVRCPECATVASVQEYPLLGRWANRWAALLAAFWLLIMLVWWIGSGAAIFGISTGASEVAAQKYRNYLADEFQSWIQSRQASSGTPGTPGRVNWSTSDYQVWIEQQGPSELFQKAGGWSGALDWSVMWVWLALVIAAFVLGCTWAVALMNQGRRARLVWGAAIMAVAVAFSTISFADWYLRSPMWYWRTAARTVCPTVMVMSLGIGGLALVAGLMCGRSLARGLICALLPPRLRSSLVFLWSTDGLPAPRPTKDQ